MAQAASYNAMPGTFGRMEHAGPKSHLYQPPHTPSASSSVYLAQSTTSILSDRSDRPISTGKKRSRHDYSMDSMATPVSLVADWSNAMETSESMARSESMDPGSPIPFVNTRYLLKGGLDTPTAGAAAAAQSIERSEYSDVGYRKSLFDGAAPTAHENGNGTYFPQTPVPQFTDANGRPRSFGHEPEQPGWSKAAIDLVGGVVGKVWEFCTAGAFRGFTAGGGRAYSTQKSEPHTPLESRLRLDRAEEKTNWLNGRGDRESTPVPGQFIEDDYISDYMDHNPRESTPPRPAKRLQVSNDDGELARNWIMVSSGPSTPAATPTSRSKPVARYSMPTASSAGRRLAGTTASRPSPRANSRRPLLHSARPSTVSHAGPQGLHSTRPASFASPRSPGGSKLASTPTNNAKKTSSGLSAQNSTASPASIEALKLAERIRKEEKETDETMRRFNAQLQAMIREGKEALGTRIEVDEVEELVMEDLDDDGFE